MGASTALPICQSAISAPWLALAYNTTHQTDTSCIPRIPRAALFVGYMSASRGLDMRDVDLKDMFKKQVEGIGPRDMHMLGAGPLTRGA